MHDDALTPPLNRTLADEIVARLRHAITSGQLRPGERLNDEVLARTLDVSRGSVREAFRQLERQGLIVARRNRGAYVARLERQDVEEVYTMRLALERLAVQRATEHAEPWQIATMQAVVERMAHPVTGDMSAQEAAELDLQFHDLLYAASKHRRLYECWTDLRPQIQIIFLTRNAANANFREQNPVVHQTLLDAIRAKDEARALALTGENLRLSYEHAIASYPE
jgi:DNA-binding GntR family transcriptional regulator